MSKRKTETVRQRKAGDAPRQKRRRITPHPASTETPIPFRWDVTRLPQLGTLQENIDTTDPSTWDRGCKGLLDGLLDCAARCIAHSGDSDLVFVGRSPESLFDLLSGLLADTGWAGRLALLQFSIGYTTTAVARRKHPEAVRAFRAYMDSLGLSPAKLLVREHPAALVDLICHGTTMHHLILFLRDWAEEEKADWPAVCRKIRIVGIVPPPDLVPRWQRRPEPWRWREDAPWISELLARGALREVVLNRDLWSYLADYQIKVTPSFTPERWGMEDSAKPCRSAQHLTALRAARKLYEAGCERNLRLRFATALAAVESGMREAWCRRLVQEVRDRAA